MRSGKHSIETAISNVQNTINSLVHLPVRVLSLWWHYGNSLNIIKTIKKDNTPKYDRRSISFPIGQHVLLTQGLPMLSKKQRESAPIFLFIKDDALGVMEREGDRSKK
ncbi:uncharacterized protein LOC123671307 isoform X2 [Harmonia axyridis]|nr:uncharacterized protein LOC123671307 isoform X2 [Harmonia axyridis]